MSKIETSRRYVKSSSFKMALFFAVQLGLAVLVLGYFGYYFARGHLVHGTEETIETEIRYLSAMDADALAAALQNPPAGRLLSLADAGGAHTGGNLAALPRDFSLLAEGILLFDVQDRRYAARFHGFPDGRRLLVAVDITDVTRNYNVMLALSLVSIVLMLVVMATSFMISTFVVSRTNRIARTAMDIMDTGNLSQRIAVDSKWDDLSYVSGVLNAFLGRVEDLVAGVQRVSDNIAHDLRTPLTRLRNRLESLKVHDPRLAEEMTAEADHLLSTFAALLRISRIETARQKNNFSDVSLDVLLRDVIELYEPLAEERGVTFAATLPDVAVRGDRDLLFQAMANLVDNAVKFSPQGGRVSVMLARESGRPVITVSDQGAGVPPDERDKVFTRFYRSDSSRHTPGSGLGLSLVAAVTGLHDAHIVLDDAAPGLRVKITF